MTDLEALKKRVATLEEVLAYLVETDEEADCRASRIGLNVHEVKEVQAIINGESDMKEVHQYDDQTPADLSEVGQWSVLSGKGERTYLCEVDEPVRWVDQEGAETVTARPDGKYTHLVYDGSKWSAWDDRMVELVTQQGERKEIDPSQKDF